MIGAVTLVGYVLSIPLANWMIANVGTHCFSDGHCVVPVWPGIYCPSGSLMVGIALVLRDVVQRAYGARAGLLAIVAGALMSAAVSPPAIVVASVVSFAVSELADFAVYTPLQRRNFVMAVGVSSIVGLVVDGVLFLAIAFGSMDLLVGIVLGKLWMVAAALPVMFWVRRKLPA